MQEEFWDALLHPVRWAISAPLSVFANMGGGGVTVFFFFF